jgi:uncharacterized protein with beta-barrel porin domain
VARTFITDGGAPIVPELRLGSAREVANDSRALNLGAAGGSTLLLPGVRPSRNMLSGGVGVTMQLQNSLYLFGNYDVIMPTGNTMVHTVQAGLRLRF